MDRTTTNHARIRAGRRGRRAFTLVELVVVVAVIVLVVGITIPAVSTIWEQRKVAEAENIIQGLLMTTRARALRPDGLDSGVFFYVDRDGVQRVRSIVQAGQVDVIWQNVFDITDDRELSLPRPIRVVPRYVVDRETVANRPYAFRPEELANELFYNPQQGVDPDVGQRHRNFFVLLYSGQGELRIRRDVLLRDTDTIDDNNRVGDRTGLVVGGVAGTQLVTEYYTQEAMEPTSIDPLGLGRGVTDLVTDPNGVAINFPSVDGLMLYDDSAFQDSGFGDNAADLKRKYLLENAQPFYINRWTGAVVRGPVGEAPIE